MKKVADFFGSIYLFILSLIIAPFFMAGNYLLMFLFFAGESIFSALVLYLSLSIYKKNMDITRILYLTTPILALYYLLLYFSPVENAFLFLVHFLVIYLLFKVLPVKESSSKGMAIAILVILIYVFNIKAYDVFIVYSLILVLIYYFRHLFDHQGIILLHRTKIGIKLMNKWSRHKKLWDWFSYFGVSVGFVGMLAMASYLFYNLFDVVVNSALPGIAPVLPGIKVPGSPIVLPLWHGLISIFLVAMIHEFSHGVVARRHKLKVDNTGVMLMGPFVGGAFVDIDEKQLVKASLWKQLSTLAAGPFSNILMAALLVVLFGFLPLFAHTNTGFVRTFTDYTSIVDFSNVAKELNEPVGFKVNDIANGTAAWKAGIPKGIIITQVNGTYATDDVDKFVSLLINTTPNETLVIGNSTVNWTIVTGVNPHDSKRGYIGLSSLEFVEKPSEKAIEKYGQFGYVVVRELFTFLLWLIIISLGIGVANLIPIGPVDGGRMLLAVLEYYFPKKKAKMIWTRISAVILFVIGLILIFPFFSWIFK